MPLHVSNTVVFIIRRSKLYYISPGIITLSKKVAFIQLLKLYCVYLLYINCQYTVSIYFTLISNLQKMQLDCC